MLAHRKPVSKHLLTFSKTETHIETLVKTETLCSKETYSKELHYSKEVLAAHSNKQVLLRNLQFLQYAIHSDCTVPASVNHHYNGWHKHGQVVSE
jgi:hypothetical protein